MSLRHPQLSLSVSPEDLEFAAALGVAVELKFDWEHTDLLVGRRSLASRLETAGVPPSQVRSVHLPPGTQTRGDDIGMAATEANRGQIIDFVQSQLGAVPDAFLVLHPPKQFEYSALLSVLGDLCRLTGRDFAIENTSVESDWHTPEDLAFFAYAGASTSALDSLYLTADSAHLPHRGHASQVDRERLDAIVERIETEPLFTGSAVGDEFREFVEQSVEGAATVIPNDSSSAWTPLLNAFALTGGRVRNVHLNDPVSDGLPQIDSHEDDGLDTVASVARRHDAQLVLEPGPATGEEIRDTVRDLVEWLDV
jgi:hypothetical protein